MLYETREFLFGDPWYRLHQGLQGLRMAELMFKTVGYKRMKTESGVLETNLIDFFLPGIEEQAQTDGTQGTENEYQQEDDVPFGYIDRRISILLIIRQVHAP